MYASGDHVRITAYLPRICRIENQISYLICLWEDAEFGNITRPFGQEKEGSEEEKQSIISTVLLDYRIQYGYSNSQIVRIGEVGVVHDALAVEILQLSIDWSRYRNPNVILLLWLMDQSLLAEYSLPIILIPYPHHTFKAVVA